MVVTLIIALLSVIDGQQLIVQAKVLEVFFSSQAGKQGETEETDHSRLIGGRIKQQNIHRKQSWVAPRLVTFYICPPES